MSQPPPGHFLPGGDFGMASSCHPGQRRQAFLQLASALGQGFLRDSTPASKTLMVLGVALDHFGLRDFGVGSGGGCPAGLRPRSTNSVPTWFPQKP